LRARLWSDRVRVLSYASDKRWAEPLAWQRRAVAQGVRYKVFCGSMLDVFEGLREQRPALDRLYTLIDATPNLDWLLLTKRPNNIRKLIGSSSEAKAASRLGVPRTPCTGGSVGEAPSPAAPTREGRTGAAR
jgi:protein gp37